MAGKKKTPKKKTKNTKLKIVSERERENLGSGSGGVRERGVEAGGVIGGGGRGGAAAPRERSGRAASRGISILPPRNGAVASQRC